MAELIAKPGAASSDQKERVALLLEYNGKSFRGSQFQPAWRTVQGEMMAALKQLNMDVSGYIASSRTDSGVHSRGSVVRFDVPKGGLKNVPDLRLALNRFLPDDLRVKDWRIGCDGFHALKAATHKWYRYKIYNAPQPSVWMPPDAVWVREPLDVARMNRAARLITGEHNFKSFKCPDTSVEDDVCRVTYAHVLAKTSHEGGLLVIFDIVSNRFLYKMVRNLMGQLVTIGRDNQPPESILDVLDQQDRQAASTAADPNGLCLMAVNYPAPYNYFSRDQHIRILNQLIHLSENAPTRTEDLKETESETDVSSYENLLRKAS